MRLVKGENEEKGENMSKEVKLSVKENHAAATTGLHSATT